VAISALITFNRLKELSTDIAAIAAAVRAANSERLEVSEDNLKVRAPMLLKAQREKKRHRCYILWAVNDIS
jgi:hypothetical protein